VIKKDYISPSKLIAAMVLDDEDKAAKNINNILNTTLKLTGFKAKTSFDGTDEITIYNPKGEETGLVFTLEPETTPEELAGFAESLYQLSVTNLDEDSKVFVINEKRKTRAQAEAAKAAEAANKKMNFSEWKEATGGTLLKEYNKYKQS
jgi:hypothetical protein